MALIPVKIPWTKKPPREVQLQIDWANPITKGLWIAGGHHENERDLTGKHQLNTDTAGHGVGRKGRCAQSYQGDGRRTAWNIDKTELTDKVTCLSVFQYRTATGNGQGELIGVNRSGQASFGLQRRGDSGGNPGRIQFVADNGTTFVTAEEAVDLTGTDTHVVAGRYDGANVTVWRAGTQRASSALTGNIQQSQDIAQTTGEHTNAAANDVNLFLSLIWLRALSDKEIASISRNPWQIFKPKVIWLPVAEAAERTITANQVEDGDTTSASIQVLSQISANQIEDGDITAASLESLIQITANQIEDGDSQVAALSVATNITANQTEAGDVTNASLEIPANIIANQLEIGDITAASLETITQIMANQEEAGDIQSASMQVLAQIAANQTEDGDTQVAAFVESLAPPTSSGLEYTSPKRKFHFQAEGERFNYTTEKRKFHYSGEDN